MKYTRLDDDDFSTVWRKIGNSQQFSKKCRCSTTRAGYKKTLRAQWASQGCPASWPPKFWMHRQNVCVALLIGTDNIEISCSLSMCEGVHCLTL